MIRGIRALVVAAICTIGAYGAAVPDPTGWWPPFVPRSGWAASATPARGPASGEEVVLADAETAGISGFRRLWDQPLVLREAAAGTTSADWLSGSDAVAFDAVHRSLLVRFPNAPEALATLLAKRGLVRAELVLTFQATELMAPGYLEPAGQSFLGSQWRDQAPRWSAIAWPLRRAWRADRSRGPTYNAAVPGVAWWSRFGAACVENDRYPQAIGPSELSQAHPECRLDITATLTDATYGRTLGERLRRLGDCGFLVRKAEVYDAAYWNGGYEWGTATGPRAILVRAPRLVLTLRSGGGAAVTLPAAADLRAGSGEGPTAVLPDAATLQMLARRFQIQRQPWMDDEAAQRVQQLLRLSGGATPQTWPSTYPTDAAGYAAWIDRLLSIPPRRWAGFDSSEAAQTISRYWDAMPEPVREHLRLYWWSWLMPDRDISTLMQPITQRDAIMQRYRTDRDWRGHGSLYRSYCHQQGPMNFNYWCIMGTAAGAGILASDRLTADSRHGMDRFLLRMWTWADGSSQESIDHYYFAHSLVAQKAFADHATDLTTRMMGRSILAKNMSDVIMLFHPQLRRFTSGSTRTGLAYTAVIQDGLQAALHTLDPRGAYTDFGSERVGDGIPVIGHDLKPHTVGEMALDGPWGAAWYGDLIANRSLPSVSLARTWGGMLQTAYQAPAYGIASRDLPRNDTVPFLVQWRRQSGERPVASASDLATLIGRFGLNRTELLDTIHHDRGENNSNGVVGLQGGLLQTLQHRSRLLLFATPFKGFDAGQQARPLPAPITSVQFTLGLLAFGSAPEVRIDGRKVSLPARATIGQTIVLRDAGAWCAIRPLVASDLGRDAEVVIGSEQAQATRMQGGGSLQEMLRIDIHLARGRTVDRALPAVEHAAVITALQVAAPGEFADVAAFEAALARQPPVVRSDGGRFAIGWPGADGAMEAVWSPAGGGAFQSRRIGGRPFALPDGIQRISEQMAEGSGRLEAGGAVLELGGGTGLLLADPVGGRYEGWNGLGDPARFALAVPGGISAQSSGPVGILRVAIDTAGPAVHIESAPTGGRVTLALRGMRGATITVNGNAYGGSADAIPLDVPWAAAATAASAADAKPRERPARNRARPEPKPAAAPAAAPPALAEDVVAPWRERVRQRAIARSAGGAAPVFRLSGFGGSVRIVTVTGDDTFTVQPEGGPGRMDLRWQQLRPVDWQQLAEALVVRFDQDSHAEAAFFAALVGDNALVQRHLTEAGPAGEAVRELMASTSRAVP